MHRTDSRDPDFGPVVYGEVWVRIKEEEGHYRHFHVAPPADSTGQTDRMTVEQAEQRAKMLNDAEAERAHMFDYYAVRIEVRRVAIADPVVAGH